MSCRLSSESACTGRRIFRTAYDRPLGHTGGRTSPGKYGQYGSQELSQSMERDNLMGGGKGSHQWRRSAAQHQGHQGKQKTQQLAREEAQLAAQCQSSASKATKADSSCLRRGPAQAAQRLLVELVGSGRPCRCQHLLEPRNT